MKKISNSLKLSFNGKLLLLIIILFFFEGSFGKWYEQYAANILIGFRDFVGIVLIYRLAVKKSIVRFSNIESGFFVFSCVLIIWALLQLMINGTPLSVFLIGLRFWLLYQWLAILIASRFETEDLFVISKVLVILMICSTPLSLAQHFLPPTHFLNLVNVSEESEIFMVAPGIVRTTGTFSFTTGFVIFLSLCAPFVISNKIFGKQIFSKKFNLFCLFCLFVSTITSGSRTAVISLGIYLVLFYTFELFSGRVNKETAWGIGLAAIMIVCVPIILPDAVDALLDRFQAASQSESILDRLRTSIFGENELIDSYSFLGFALGAGSNAGSLIMFGANDFVFGETESSKIISEIGFLGIIWILLKFIFLMWGLWKAMLISRNKTYSGAIVYWVVCAVALMTWPTVGQVSVNVIGSMAILFALGSLVKVKP